MNNHYITLGLSNDKQDQIKKAKSEIEEQAVQQMIQKAHNEQMNRHKENNAQDKQARLAIQMAFDTLNDKKKRDNYNKLLETQNSVEMSIFKDKDPNNKKTYQSMESLLDIQKKFHDFATEKCGTPEEAKKRGYSSTILTDKKTGAECLLLTFPDKASMDEFINNMLTKGYIKETPAQKVQNEAQKDSQKESKSESEHTAATPLSTRPTPGT